MWTALVNLYRRWKAWDERKLKPPSTGPVDLMGDMARTDVGFLRSDDDAFFALFFLFDDDRWSGDGDSGSGWDHDYSNDLNDGGWSDDWDE